MSFLITGANGFIGNQLCAELIRQSFSTKAAARNFDDFNYPIEKITIPAINCHTDWSQALLGVKVVVHLAARVHVIHDTVDNQLDEFLEVNLHGTVNLARQAAASGVKRFVYVSSIKVNGERASAGMSFSESDIPQPKDAYAISKWQAEEALRTISRETRMEVVIVRPPLVYGPGVRANFLRLMQLVERRIPLPFGLIKNKRSLLFVGNLVDALTVLATHPAAKDRTYLIADREVFSTPELVTVLAGLLGKSPCLIPIPWFLLRLMGQLSGKSAEIERLTQSLQINSSAICNELNWTPPYSSIEGLQLTVEAYQNAARNDANQGEL